MDHNSDDIIERVINAILVSAAFIFAAIGSYLSTIDLLLGILVKLTSLVSFTLFLVINRVKIKEGIVEICCSLVRKGNKKNERN
jgi:hypothetical protein